jgi:hypothetical protein
LNGTSQAANSSHSDQGIDCAGNALRFSYFQPPLGLVA